MVSSSSSPPTSKAPIGARRMSGVAGNLAFAAILYVGPDAERQRDAVRELPEQQGVAMSASDNRLVVRALAPTGLALRRAIIPIIARLSGAGSLPRLWSF